MSNPKRTSQRRFQNAIQSIGQPYPYPHIIIVISSLS
jgi:hypothetical protein